MGSVATTVQQGLAPFRSVLVALPAGSGRALIDRVSALSLGRPMLLALLRIAPWLARFWRALLDRTRAVLSADVQRARDLLHVGDVQAIFSTRPAVREIADEARAVRAELIVMARDAGPAATRVVRATKLPVLVARRGGAHHYRRPLIALDLEGDGMRLLALALRVLAPPRPALAMVHAYDAPFERIAYPSLSPGTAAAYHRMGGLLARFHLECMLAAARTRVSADDGPWSCHVHRGDPRNVIPRVARELACDLLVIGTRVRRGLAAVLIGSTAAELSRAVACDVLLVPIPRHDQPERVHPNG